MGELGGDGLKYLAGGACRIRIFCPGGSRRADAKYLGRRGCVGFEWADHACRYLGDARQKHWNRCLRSSALAADRISDKAHVNTDVAFANASKR